MVERAEDFLLLLLCPGLQPGFLGSQELRESFHKLGSWLVRLNQLIKDLSSPIDSAVAITLEHKLFDW